MKQNDVIYNALKERYENYFNDSTYKYIACLDRDALKQRIETLLKEDIEGINEDYMNMSFLIVRMVYDIGELKRYIEYTNKYSNKEEG